MELVRACSLTGYFAVAEQLGLETTRLFRQAGLARSMVSHPEQMLPARSVVQLLEDSASASGCVTFGFRMAAERQVSDIGMVSLLLVHQPTLRDSLDVLSEFRSRLNSHLSLQIEEHGDTVVLRQHFALNPPMFSRQANDASLGVHYKLLRAVMGDDWRPHSVCLSHERPAPAHRAIYHRLFDCPIQFGADFDGIILDSSDMARQLPRWGAALAGHARELVRRIIDPGEPTTADQVEQSIRLLMASGRATFGGVADSLGISIRTLQRYLDREGTSFSNILDRVRAQQVNQHFGNPRLRLTDVSQLLGYSTLASFSTWYKSRFRETPTMGRRRQQRGGICEKSREQTFASSPLRVRV